MTTERTKIIDFPSTEPKPRKRERRIRNVDGVKYFNGKQIKLLRRTVRDQAEIDIKKDNKTAVKEWMVIDLLTSTGLRVSEAADLRCGDLRLGYSESKIYVRYGKAAVSGHVIVNDALRRHLRAFTGYKQSIGEPVSDEDFLFIGQRGPRTSQAIQQIVKKYLKKLGLYQTGKSVHALRHSYAVELYS